MLRRIVSYVFIGAAIAGIMYLTLMGPGGTTALSEWFRNVLNSICVDLGLDVSAAWWNSKEGVRLLGHIIEYLFLGMIAGVCIKRKWLGILICVAVSLADQTVKIFVPGRHFDNGDFLFDVIGYLSGLLIGWIVACLYNMHRGNT